MDDGPMLTDVPVFYCNAGDHLVDGYDFATNKDGTYRTCYPCLAVIDRNRMIILGDSSMVELRLLYYPGGCIRVANKPRNLTMDIIKRSRRHVWFHGPDGHVWYGNVTPDGTVNYSRRTRRRY